MSQEDHQGHATAHFISMYVVKVIAKRVLSQLPLTRSILARCDAEDVALTAKRHLLDFQRLQATNKIQHYVSEQVDRRFRLSVLG